MNIIIILYFNIINLYIILSTTNIKINILLFGFILCINLILFYSKKNNKSINKKALLWILFIYISIITLNYSHNNNKINGAIFIIGVINFYITYYNLSKFDISEKYFKISYIYFSLCIIATLTQLVFPGLINNLKKIYIQEDRMLDAINRVENSSIYGGYNGLVAQVSANAFLLSNFTMFSLYKYIKSRLYKRYIYLSLIIIGLICILITNKRTILLSNIVAIYIILSLEYRKKKKTIIMISFIIISISFLVFNYTDLGNNFKQKLLYQDFTLSGRIELYFEMFKNFKNHPFIGVGIDSKVLGMDGHFIYLQILSEIGIFGAILFYYIVFTSFYDTIKVINKNVNSNLRYNLYISLYLQVIFLVWGIFGNTLYDQLVLISYFIAISIKDFIKKEIKNENCNFNLYKY